MPIDVLPIWIPAVLLSAGATIDGEFRNRRAQVYLCKPLTTILILIGALLATGGSYHWLIVAGLVFSLAGDVFLMLPGDRFKAGLVSFLIAHILYIAAFAQVLIWSWPPLWVPLVIIGLWIVFMLLLLPGARGDRVPVAVYGLVLILMAAAALGRADLLGGAALFAGVGAVLFVISDAVLGVNRFLLSFRAAEPLVLGTYFLAQMLIVLSIGG